MLKHEIFIGICNKCNKGVMLGTKDDYYTIVETCQCEENVIIRRSWLYAFVLFPLLLKTLIIYSVWLIFPRMNMVALGIFVMYFIFGVHSEINEENEAKVMVVNGEFETPEGKVYYGRLE